MSHTGTGNYSQPVYTPQAAFDAYPESDEEWRELYDWRWQQYLMAPYSANDQKSEHLFRAFDDSGNEIDQTRRIHRFYGFVADTDARALTGGRLTLETFDHIPGKSKSAQLLAGEAVWTRSRLLSQTARWARMTCVLGDWWLEPWRLNGTRPYRAVIVGHNPQCVRAWYDSTGTQLERVEIDTSILSEPMRERREVGGMGAVTEYRRILTRDEIIVEVNGKRDDAQSGRHRLGAVPAVHLQAIPWDQPEHGLPAPFGIERALMRLDSLMTQAGAVGNRFGNPTLWTKGFRLGASSQVARFGRMIDGIPADGEVGYLEAGAEGLKGLLPWLQQLVSHIRDTTPEFLFASDAAQESAEARSLRGQAFESKMLEMRGPWHAGLAEATAMAVAMDEDRALDVETNPYTIDAPPVLPQNVGREIETLKSIEHRIKRADFTRGLQRLGIVSNEHDPEVYTREVDDEQAGRATQFFTEDEETRGEEVTPEAKPAETPAGALGDVAATALNGAQMRELMEALKAVSAGVASPDATKAALRISLPMIDGAVIDEAVDKAAAFEPAAPLAEAAP
jgi:hypothetical protein